VPDPVWPAIRVRAVRGRVIDPFRGSLDEEQPERLAGRSVEAQPLDDVIDRLRMIPAAKLSRAGRRFTLRRGNEVIKVAFASAARRVSLEDAMLEGDGALAIAVVHSLLPLFGAVELQIGTYSDLIDGHEPHDAVAKRFDDWWIQDSLRVAERLQARDAAARMAAARPIAPARPIRASNGRIAIGAVACVVALIVLATGIAWLSKPSRAHIGEHCTSNADCDSNACLPREPMRSTFVEGVDLSSYLPSRPIDPTGVCTRSCIDDGGCPASMRCGPVMRYGQLGLGERASSCVPPEWYDAPPP
jgi:hypothetical protein